MDLQANIDKLPRNGSYQPLNATVCASAPSFVMSPVNLQALSLFIPPPAPFSSAQSQQLTQPPPSLPGNFEDILLS